VPSRVGPTFLILVLLCWSPLCRAQGQAAPMYAGASVTVSGAKPLAHEALPGEAIEVPANDNVILHPSGDEVKVEPDSSAVYTNQKQIELKNGTSTISTTTGIAVHVHHYTVTPTTPYSKYQVSWNKEGGRVWVYKGEVRIDGCEKKLNVPKDKIAELGRDCKLGAYLRPKSTAWYAFGLAVPASVPLCYYECPSSNSSQCMQENIGCAGTH